MRQRQFYEKFESLQNSNLFFKFSQVQNQNTYILFTIMKEYLKFGAKLVCMCMLRPWQIMYFRNCSADRAEIWCAPKTDTALSLI